MPVARQSSGGRRSASGVRPPRGLGLGKPPWRCLGRCGTWRGAQPSPCSRPAGIVVAYGRAPFRAEDTHEPDPPGAHVGPAVAPARSPAPSPTRQQRAAPLFAGAAPLRPSPLCPSAPPVGPSTFRPGAAAVRPPPTGSGSPPVGPAAGQRPRPSAVGNPTPAHQHSESAPVDAERTGEPTPDASRHTGTAGRPPDPRRLADPGPHAGQQPGTVPLPAEPECADAAHGDPRRRARTERDPAGDPQPEPGAALHPSPAARQRAGTDPGPRSSRRPQPRAHRAE